DGFRRHPDGAGVLHIVLERLVGDDDGGDAADAAPQRQVQPVIGSELQLGDDETGTIGESRFGGFERAGYDQLITCPPHRAGECPRQVGGWTDDKDSSLQASLLLRPWKGAIEVPMRLQRISTMFRYFQLDHRRQKRYYSVNNVRSCKTFPVAAPGVSCVVASGDRAFRCARQRQASRYGTTMVTGGDGGPKPAAFPARTRTTYSPAGVSG